jgi:alcohol dehydrogenase/L-iditol 2-dehydrogenase
MAALAGANPLIVSGLSADHARFDIARQLGATHTVNVEETNLSEFVRDLSPLGANVVCEASGASVPLQQALDYVQADGRVTKVGWSPQNVPIDMNPLVQKNVTLQGSFSHNYPMWEKVIHLLATGMMMPELIVGLKADITGWREAFDAMHAGKVVKSVLLPEEQRHA